MSEDIHESSNADMSPDEVKNPTVLPGLNMLESVTEAGPAKTITSATHNDSLQKDSSIDITQAHDHNMLSNNVALPTAQRRSSRIRTKSILKKPVCTAETDSTQSAIRTFSADTTEKVDGTETAEVQIEMSTSDETIILKEEKNVTDGEPVTSLEDDQIILEEAEKRTDRGNVEGESQKPKDDIDKDNDSPDSQCSSKVSEVRRDVSQVKRCPYCGFEYRGPRDLAPHMKETHPAQLVTGRGPRVVYKCLYCPESNTRPRNLRQHMHVCHPEHFSVQDLHRTLTFSCTQPGCGSSFHRAGRLRRHLVAVHGITLVQKPGLARGKVYDLGRMRERAERVEKGEQPRWGQRGAADTKKHKPSSLHTEKHKSSRLRDCHEECWRKAREGSGFSCAYCDKSFTHHSLCVGHERTHENRNKAAHSNNGLAHELYNDTFSSSVLLTLHQSSAQKTDHGADLGVDRTASAVNNSGVDRTNSVIDKTDSGAEKTDASIDKTDGRVNKTHSTDNKTDSTVDKTGGTVDKTDSTVTKTDGTVYKTDCTVEKTDGTLDKTGGTINKTNGTVDKTDGTVDKTNGTVDKTNGTVDKTDVTVDKTDITVHKTDVTIHKTEVTVDKTGGTISKVEQSESQCPVCGARFASPYYIKLHVETVHHKKAKYVCTHCGKSYLHKNGLTCHLERHHNTAPPRPRGSKPARYQCKLCEVRLTSRCGMRAHMNRHLGVRPYACRYCGRSFTSMNHRTAHEGIHTGLKAHRCPLCYKVFTNVGTLYNHLYRYKVHGLLPRGSLSNLVTGAAPKESQLRSDPVVPPGVPRGSPSAHSSNVDTLLRAAQLCQQPATSRKPPRPIRPKHAKYARSKTVLDVTDVKQPEQGQTITSIHSETFSVQHHELLEHLPVQSSMQAIENIQADPDESSSTTQVGDAVWMMPQDVVEAETQVVIESDSASTLVVPSGGEQLAPLGAEQYVTLLQGGAQLAAGQEIRIMTVEDTTAGSDPAGQQVAYIIMPQQDSHQAVGENNVYIQINMEPQGEEEEGNSERGQRWGYEQEASGGADNVPMDGVVEYVTQQTEFSTIPSTHRNIHE